MPLPCGTPLGRGKAKGVNPDRKSGAESPKAASAFSWFLLELGDVVGLSARLLRRALVPMYRLAFLRELTGAATEIEADVVAQISLTITRTLTDILLNRKLLDPADTLKNATLQTPPHRANHNLFIFLILE